MNSIASCLRLSRLLNSELNLTLKVIRSGGLLKSDRLLVVRYDPVNPLAVLEMGYFNDSLITVFQEFL